MGDSSFRKFFEKLSKIGSSISSFKQYLRDTRATFHTTDTRVLMVYYFPMFERKLMGENSLTSF
jgi:hypothetical protein